MAINFYKHHNEIVSAYKEVLDVKCSTNWAIFGYEKQTNNLLLVAKGHGGLKELQEEFSQSKILYAFCEVKDDSMNLRRYLLINWQGECAPLQRKGICLNHFNDVQNFFKDANIVLNARHEEDVEPDVLMQHVTKLASRIRIDKHGTTNGTATTTNGHHNHIDDVDGPDKPVGTNYHRTIPQREISKKESEKFWQQQKLEEEQRLKEEKLKQQQQRNELNSIKNDSCQQPQVDSPVKKVNTSQILRKERMDEAKNLISKNNISNARAFFEQNSSTSTAAAINSSSSITAATTNAHKSSNSYVNHVQSMLMQGQQPEPESVQQQQQPQQHSDSKQSEPEQQPAKHQSTISADEIDDNDEKVIESNVNNNDNDNLEDETSSDESFHMNQTIDDDDQQTNQEQLLLLQQQQQQYGYCYTEPRQLENIIEEQGEDEETAINNNDDILNNKNDINDKIEISQGLRAKALYDYQAADDTEISFDPDDIITHIEQIDSGWWQGLAPNGAYGLFPANYVELLDD